MFSWLFLACGACAGWLVLTSSHVFFVAVVFNLLAMVVTVRGLSLGFEEGNPLMAQVFGFGILAVLGVAFCAYFFLYAAKRFFSRAGNERAGFVVVNLALTVWSFDLVNDLLVVFSP